MSELRPDVPRVNDLDLWADRIVRFRKGNQEGMAEIALFNGLHGTFIDSEDAPEWSRRIARWASDKLRAECRNGWRAEDQIALELRGKGRGQRAVHFQHAMNLDPKIFTGSQSNNNCCAWCTREIVGACIAVDKIENGELHGYETRPGTAGPYANRGSRADAGMALSEGAEAVHVNGITLEKNYKEVGIDISTQKLDEAAGVKWGASGVPSALRDIVKGDLIEQVSNVQEEEAVLDILFGGSFISTGSTRTAGDDGDPISPIGSVGGHAQAMIGYDDTDEFRERYKQTTGKTLNDWVGIFDQSWGPNWRTVKNWPEHLWGPRPEGAFVLVGKDAMKLITIWGEALAMCKVKGYPLRKLPDWGSGEYL